MESSGVPAQGVSIELLRRGSRGQLGPGNRAARVRARWRKWNAQQGAPKHMLRLRAWARTKGKDEPEVKEWAKAKGMRL